MERSKTYKTLSAGCCALVAAAALAACGGVSSSASSSKSSNNGASNSVSAGSGAVLTIESSQQNAITKNFNPYVPSSAASLLGATSLIYEPLLQANALKPGQYYNWLATGYSWSDGGKAITFTIRPGVKWSNGSALTAADVAFTYQMLKKYPDANTSGLAIEGVSSAGNKVTIKFPSPQYANLQNIAGQVYIVPQSIWSKVGDPGKYTDADPVGSGPYTLSSFAGQGFTLQANPSYWGGKPAVSKVEFPTYASANAALSALQTDQLDWGGNFISGVQQVFESGNANHKVWFPPVQTNSLEPNLTKFPTNQLAVRKAISLAIDRTALSQQAEGGLEPPVSNASGLTLPVFQQFLSPDVASSTLPAHPDIAGAQAVLKQAGYVMGSDGLFRTKSGQKLSIDITNPSSFADYATGDELIAKQLRAAGIDARFVGQSVDAWSSDIATGNFQLTQHWSQTSVAPYQLYNDWLNSAQATNNAAGDYERLKDPSVDTMLGKLAADSSAQTQKTDLAPIEKYVASNLPIIPTVYGVAFDEYNTGKFTGWPTQGNPYESGSPNTPTNEVVILHLRPSA
ncbi:MAG TPA: ABC transporter substrate-binding protein [Solirubrobacteraceae bacterium]|nr:ABC transporter substrate-binding protein [Solirubrobacteraceae bacterium]